MRVYVWDDDNDDDDKYIDDSERRYKVTFPCFLKDFVNKGERSGLLKRDALPWLAWQTATVTIKPPEYNQPSPPAHVTSTNDCKSTYEAVIVKLNAYIFVENLNANTDAIMMTLAF